MRSPAWSSRDRFPEDFMFQLTAEEAERSRSQIATLKSGRGQNIKYRPYAFTEHGGNSSPRTPIGFTADLTEMS